MDYPYEPSSMNDDYDLRPLEFDEDDFEEDEDDYGYFDDPYATEEDDCEFDDYEGNGFGGFDDLKPFGSFDDGLGWDDTLL